MTATNDWPLCNQCQRQLTTINQNARPSVHQESNGRHIRVRYICEIDKALAESVWHEATLPLPERVFCLRHGIGFVHPALQAGQLTMKTTGNTPMPNSERHLVFVSELDAQTNREIHKISVGSYNQGDVALVRGALRNSLDRLYHGNAWSPAPRVRAQDYLIMIEDIVNAF